MVWNSADFVSIRAFEPFLNLPSLRTVRSIEDDGEWCTIAPNGELGEVSPHRHGESLAPARSIPSLPSDSVFTFIFLQTNTFPTTSDQSAFADGTGERWARRNIMTLELTHTPACLIDMEDIAQLFPSLQILLLEPQRVPDGKIERYAERGSRRVLSTALGKMKSLRKLKIVIYPIPNITTNLYNDIAASLGPGNVLDLARMPDLQHLEVPCTCFLTRASYLLVELQRFPARFYRSL